MKTIITIMLFAITASFAQHSTIDIDRYKKSQKYSFAEKLYTVGKHVFRVVNIKSLANSDTSCISAIVLDKRKYVCFDIGVNTGPLGMVVPPAQTIAGGLIVLKASPYEGKTFLILPDGKLVTLPGSSVIVDTIGKCVYCVWDNDKNFKLTVFDYKNLRLIINTTEIAEPKQWYSVGMEYCFTTGGTDNSTRWYTVDFMTKTITRGEKPDGETKAVSYFGGLDKIDRKQCCGAQVLKK